MRSNFQLDKNSNNSSQVERRSSHKISFSRILWPIALYSISFGNHLFNSSCYYQSSVVTGQESWIHCSVHLMLFVLNSWGKKSGLLCPVLLLMSSHKKKRTTIVLRQHKYPWLLNQIQNKSKSPALTNAKASAVSVGFAREFIMKKLPLLFIRT